MLKIKYLIAIIFLLFIAIFFWHALFIEDHQRYTSNLTGNKVASFHLNTTIPLNQTFSQENLFGHLSLINFWATWCYACKLEHETLLKIKNDYHIPIYGVLYKDDSTHAISWLQQAGNPYDILANDAEGKAAIQFGIYGTPETYLIDQNANIIYRHVGVLNEWVWTNKFLPLILRRIKT